MAPKKKSSPKGTDVTEQQTGSTDSGADASTSDQSSTSTDGSTTASSEGTTSEGSTDSSAAQEGTTEGKAGTDSAAPIEPVVVTEVSIVTDVVTSSVSAITGGTEVGDASADVGTVAAPVVNAAVDFAQAVINRDKNQRLTSLFLTDYSTELQDGVLAVLDSADTTQATKTIIVDVLKYATEMGPTCPVMGGSGVKHQQDFFNGFTSFVNYGPIDFRIGMNVVLAIIAESIALGTGFSEHLPMRFLPNVALSPDKVKGLERLMHLLTSTADASTRALTLRQIDLPNAVRYGLSTDGRDRLIGFYAI